MKTAEELYKEMEDIIPFNIQDGVKPYILEAMTSYSDQFKNKWIDVEKELPKEGGRYWCFCTEQTELGKSFFQWNCYYDPTEKEFRDDHQKVYVTHWTYLLDWPKYDTL